jgi:hypothetical protein
MGLGASAFMIDLNRMPIDSPDEQLKSPKPRDANIGNSLLKADQEILNRINNLESQLQDIKQGQTLTLSKLDMLLSAFGQTYGDYPQSGNS